MATCYHKPTLRALIDMLNGHVAKIESLINVILHIIIGVAKQCWRSRISNYSNGNDG